MDRRLLRALERGTFARSVAPQSRLPRLGSLPRTPPDPAVTYPTVRLPEMRVTERSLRDWPDPPPWWSGPVTEWVCWWWLTTVKGFRFGYDFDYQVALSAKGIFVGRDFTRVDFWLPIGADHPASAEGLYDAVVWDPITPFTHADANLDYLKRLALHQQRVRLVWIDGDVLEADPRGILAEALRGIDHSSRNQLAPTPR